MDLKAVPNFEAELNQITQELDYEMSNNNAKLSNYNDIIKSNFLINKHNKDDVIYHYLSHSNYKKTKITEKINKVLAMNYKKEKEKLLKNMYKQKESTLHTNYNVSNSDIDKDKKTPLLSKKSTVSKIVHTRNNSKVVHSQKQRSLSNSPSKLNTITNNTNNNNNSTNQNYYNKRKSVIEKQITFQNTLTHLKSINDFKEINSDLLKPKFKIRKNTVTSHQLYETTKNILSTMHHEDILNTDLNDIRKKLELRKTQEISEKRKMTFINDKMSLLNLNLLKQTSVIGEFEDEVNSNNTNNSAIDSGFTTSNNNLVKVELNKQNLDYNNKVNKKSESQDDLMLKQKRNTDTNFNKESKFSHNFKFSKDSNNLESESLVTTKTVNTVQTRKEKEKSLHKNKNSINSKEEYKASITSKNTSQINQKLTTNNHNHKDNDVLNDNTNSYFLYPWKIISHLNQKLLDFKNEILDKDLTGENVRLKYTPLNFGNATTFLEKYALIKNKLLFDFIKRFDRELFKSKKKRHRKIFVILDERVVITSNFISGGFIEIPTSRVSCCYLCYYIIMLFVVLYF